MPSKKPAIGHSDGRRAAKGGKSAPDKAPHSNKPPTKLQLAWCGGVLIGIGNISNGKPRADEKSYPLLLQMNSQDEYAIKAFARIMSYYVAPGRKYKGVAVYSRKVNVNPTYTIYLTTARAEAVLRPLYPFIAKTKKGAQYRDAFSWAGLEIK